MAVLVKEYEIKWRPQAKKDLLNIIDHIEKDNPINAKRFGKALTVKIGLLSVYPNRGRLGFISGTRELVVHRHYIAIYCIKLQCVEILRLKHTTQQF